MLEVKHHVAAFILARVDALLVFFVSVCGEDALVGGVYLEELWEQDAREEGLREGVLDFGHGGVVMWR
jgi:hypothetical protein